jgi:hypothetical protein
MNIYQAEHLSDLPAAERMLSKIAGHLSNMPTNKLKALQVGRCLRAAQFCLIEYTQGIVDGLDPFDSMAKAVEVLTDEAYPVKLPDADLVRE